MCFRDIRWSDGKQILIQYHEVCEFADFNRARLRFEAIGIGRINRERGERLGQIDAFSWQKRRARLARGAHARDGYLDFLHWIWARY